jgi:NAD(P) transhydrogenase subunit alpha
MTELLEFIKQNLQIIYIIILSAFVGVELIKSIPAVLHTPLMSGANALSGVVIMGAVIVMLNSAEDDYVALTLGFIAIVLGIINVVGGFAVTDRMLEMFKKKK